ncbi:hypothetical protein HYC85_003959 [Camellia sinensis]|uniref:Uncharacterized protein n=1 Tax=Camellia sinensis TaxID=4442 RepID=A0A7J7HXB9_CAMSI|nr:hypothetical protein HYC85_003959 [Camellia sinensis]
MEALISAPKHFSLPYILLITIPSNLIESKHTRLFLINPRDSLNSALSRSTTTTQNLPPLPPPLLFSSKSAAAEYLIVSFRRRRRTEEAAAEQLSLPVASRSPIGEKNWGEKGEEIMDWKTERYKEIIKSGSACREEVIIVAQHSENGKHNWLMYLDDVTPAFNFSLVD